MSERIPESYLDLIEEPVFVTLVTMMPDGQPQASVVWCNYEPHGDYVLVNTAQHRQKAKNMRENPKVTLLAVDPENPYRYLEVRGRVAEMTEEGGLDHIHQLAGLYMDVPQYYGEVAPAERRDKEVRVICKIEPTRVRAVG
jgi:PPOX class probable F420-dependent enzyme